MFRARRIAVYLSLACAALAGACAEDSPSAPTVAGVAPRAQGGATDPLIAPVGLTGTWKGTLTASYLPMGYARWEFRVSRLTDSTFYATAREIVPQTNGSSFTISNIAAWGKNTGSSVSMRVYIGNAADFTGTLDASGNNMSGNWLYGVVVPGLHQATGTLTLAR